MYHDIKYSGCNLAHSSDMTSNVLNRPDLKFHTSQQHPEWKSTGGSMIVDIISTNVHTQYLTFEGLRTRVV